MFDRYTTHASRVVYLSQALAQAARHPQAGDAHLLLALTYEHQSSAARALTSLGLTRDNASDAVYAALTGTLEAPWNATMPLSPRLHTVLQDAAAEAIGLGCAYVSTGHLLLSLALERDSDGRGSAAGILKRLGADPADVRDVMLGMLRGEDSEQPAVPDHDHAVVHDAAVCEEVIQRLDRLDRRLGGVENQLGEHMGDSLRIQRKLGLADLHVVPPIR